MCVRKVKVTIVVRTVKGYARSAWARIPGRSSGAVQAQDTSPLHGLRRVLGNFLKGRALTTLNCRGTNAAPVAGHPLMVRAYWEGIRSYDGQRLLGVHDLTNRHGSLQSLSNRAKPEHRMMTRTGASAQRRVAVRGSRCSTVLAWRMPRYELHLVLRRSSGTRRRLLPGVQAPHRHNRSGAAKSSAPNTSSRSSAWARHLRARRARRG